MPSVALILPLPDAKKLVKIWWIVCLIALLSGCVTRSSYIAPPCPAPSLGAAHQLSDLIFHEDQYDDLIDWVSEIDRYCLAIDEFH